LPATSTVWRSVITSTGNTTLEQLREQLGKFARTAWQFGRGDGSRIAPRLELQFGGKVQFSPYPNERYWSVRNGNLCFLNANREVTTEFTDCTTDEYGRRVLRGAFLSGSKRVLHVLTELPALGKSVIPNPPPRVAVLVRTHVVNEKLYDLISILSNSSCFDLFVCADCTTTELEIDGVLVLRHRVEDARKMGLPTDHPNLMWYCGDYAFYFAHAAIPDYDYYFMVEYDVDFVDRSPLLLEGIINRLEFPGPAAIDFVGCRCWIGSFDSGWGTTVAGIYPQPHLCLFPFVVLSRRAIEHLMAQRQAEQSAPIAPGRLMFCEAFVPSALNAAGFRCVDLNSLVHGSVREATFRITGYRGPMLLLQRRDLDAGIKLLHPVYDEKNFLEYHLRKARQAQDRAVLAALIGADSPLALSARSMDLIRQCMDELPEPQAGGG
jgi:hypothetical protein